jgi:hypothetical protein
MLKFWRRLKAALSCSAFWDGFGSAFDVGGPGFRPVYPPARTEAEGFSRDAAAIRSDWEAVLGPNLGRNR